MDRGAPLRTGDVGSGPGGTKDARKKVLGPHDGGGGPSTVIALGGNGSSSSHPTKPVDLDANTKKRYRPRHFKRVNERSNRRKRDQDERLFTKGLKATATNEEPNRKERREGVQGFKPAKKTVKLSVPPPKPVIVDDGSNKFGSLHVESEVTSSLISKTTTVSTTTSVEEDVYWSPCESTGKTVISYKVEDLDPKDERDSKICNVVLRGNHYINKQERRTTFVGALKTHFDAHKSGDDGLSKKEVNAALKSFAKKDRTGKFPKLEELEALFGDMDLNGAGRVSYDELTDFIDDIDADDIGAGRNHRGKGAGGIKTIYLKEDRVPKLDYIYREDLQVTYSLKLGRLKLRLKLRYIIQQLAFRRQHKVSLKVTHLMAETFKHNLMFLNNIPNKDVVVSHGLLALPSTSAFDGAATAAPGEASFEGQHAALAALGQAVLAALGVAFFQGSTPIDVVGGYVFSLDVLGDALSLDVLTNSNVLHKTGFMGAAPTVVFLGGSEGLNALLLDASAAAALDGVFKGLFGVAALRGQPVVVGAAPDVPWYNSSDGLDVFSGNLCQRAGGARLVGALTDSLDGLRKAGLAAAVADAACVQGSASLDVALCQNSPRAVARLVGALTDSLDGLRKAGLAAAVADAACVQGSASLDVALCQNSPRAVARLVGALTDSLDGLRTAGLAAAAADAACVQGSASLDVALCQNSPRAVARLVGALTDSLDELRTAGLAVAVADAACVQGSASLDVALCQNSPRAAARLVGALTDSLDGLRKAGLAAAVADAACVQGSASLDVALCQNSPRAVARLVGALTDSLDGLRTASLAVAVADAACVQGSASLDVALCQNSPRAAARLVGALTDSLDGLRKAGLAAAVADAACVQGSASLDVALCQNSPRAVARLVGALTDSLDGLRTASLAVAVADAACVQGSASLDVALCQNSPRAAARLVGALTESLDGLRTAGLAAAAADAACVQGSASLDVALCQNSPRAVARLVGALTESLDGLRTAGLAAAAADAACVQGSASLDVAVCQNSPRAVARLVGALTDSLDGLRTAGLAAAAADAACVQGSASLDVAVCQNSPRAVARLVGALTDSLDGLRTAGLAAAAADAACVQGSASLDVAVCQNSPRAVARLVGALTDSLDGLRTAGLAAAAADAACVQGSASLDVAVCQNSPRAVARLVGALTDSLDGLRTAGLAAAAADAACVQGSASLDVAVCQNSPRAVARLVGALTDSLDGLRTAGLAAAAADAACVQDPEAVLSDKPLLAEAMEEDRLDSMKEQKVIQILVMTASGAMPSVFVKPWATVGDLMLVIQQMMDVPLSKYQHLQSIGGRPMQNAALLQHYDIQNNSTVVLSEPWPGHLLGGSLLSLKELIDKGSLNVGDIIVFREHNHQEEGELLENGWIRHEGTVYKSASAFVGAMRGKPSSGYDFLYTATGTPIQSLRSDPSDSSSNGDDLRSDSNSDDEAPPQPPGDQQLAGRRQRQPTDRFDHQQQEGEYYVKRGSAVGGAGDGDDDVVMEDDDERSQLQQAPLMSTQPIGNSSSNGDDSSSDSSEKATPWMTRPTDDAQIRRNQAEARRKLAAERERLKKRPLAKGGLSSDGGSASKPSPQKKRAPPPPPPHDADMEDEDEQLQLQRALIMSKQRMGEGLVKDDGKPAAKPKRKRRVIEECDEEDDGGALEGLTSQPSLPEPPSKNDDGHPSATADHARPGGVPPPPSLPPAKRSCQSSSPTSGNVRVFFDSNALPEGSVLEQLSSIVTVVNRPRTATHIVCNDPLRPSPAFIAASCVVRHAVTHKWVQATIDARQPVTEMDYVVDSRDAEQSYRFNLADNLRLNREVGDRTELRLLQGYAVCEDPNFQWENMWLDNLEEITVCSDAIPLRFSNVVNFDGDLPKGVIIICKDDSGPVDEAVLENINFPTHVVKYWDLCECLLRRTYSWEEEAEAPAPAAPDSSFKRPATIDSLRENHLCWRPRPPGSAIVHGDYDPLEVLCANAANATPAEVVAWTIYGNLRLQDLKDLLEANGQSKFGNEAFVLRKVIDGAARGAPAICGICGEGKPKPVEDELGKWFCNGYYDERSLSYVRCPQTWTDATLPRKQWIDTDRGFGGRANPPSVPLPTSFTQDQVSDFYARAETRPVAPAWMRAQVDEALAPAPRQGDANTLNMLGELVDQLNPMVVQNSSAADRVRTIGMTLVGLARSGGDGDDHEEEGKTGGDPSPPPAQPARPLPEKVKEWPTNFMKLLRGKKVKCKFESPNPKRGASAARYDGYMGATNIGDYFVIFRGNMSDLRNDITKGYCQLDKSERDDAWLEYLESGEDLQSKAEKPKAKKPKAKPAAKSGAGAEDTTDEDMFGTNTTPPAEPLVLPPDWNESKQRAKDPELEAAVCALGAALTGKTSFTKEWDLLLKHRCYCFYIHEDDPANKAVKNLEVPIGWPSYKEFSKSPKKNRPSSLKLLGQYLKYALRLAKEGGEYCLDDEQSESNRWWPEEREKFHEAMATLNIKRSGGAKNILKDDCRRIAESIPNKTTEQVKRQARTYFESLDAESEAIRKLTRTGDPYVKSVLDTDAIVLPEFLFCIISTGRWLDAKLIELRLLKAGLEASQILWVVGTPAEEAKYKLQCSGEVVVGGGLSASRNKALDEARRRGRVCVQLRDSVWKCEVIQEGPEEGGSLADFYNKNSLWKEPASLKAANIAGSKKVEVTLVAAAKLLYKLMKATDKRLAGCFPVPNEGFAASKEPVQQRELVDERLLVIDPKDTELKFDESLIFREVDEFTAQHFRKHDGICRSNRVLCVGQNRKGKSWVTPEGISEEDKRIAIDSLLNKHRHLFRERILHNRRTRPHDRYVLSWEQDASSEPKDQNETMEDVQPGEQTVLSTQLPFDAGSLAALECPPVPPAMRKPTPEEKFIRFSFLLRETVKCEKGEESEAALIVPHEAGKVHEHHKGQTRVLDELVKGRFTHRVKFASRASKKLTILGEDDYGFEFIPKEAPAMYRDMKCIFVLDPRAKGSSFTPRCAHAKGFVTLAPGCACGLECPEYEMEIHQHHITAHERDCLLAPSTHCINSGLLASGLWGKQQGLHEQLNTLWEMIKHQHSINDKTFVHLNEISVPVQKVKIRPDDAYRGHTTLWNELKPGGELSKHLKVADPTRVHELLPEGLPDDVATGGTYYELKKDSEQYFPFWGRDTLLYYESKKTLSVVYGYCPITGVGGRRTKKGSPFPLVLHHIRVGDKECFVGFINDRVNQGLGSTGAPNPFA